MNKNTPIDWQARAQAVMHDFEIALAEFFRARANPRCAATELNNLDLIVSNCRLAIDQLFEETSKRAEAAELERVRRACGEMRKTLLETYSDLGPRMTAEMKRQLQSALSTDAGSGYHHRDEFKPLWEALQKLIDGSFCSLVKADSRCPRCAAIEALADAKAKGLI